MVRLFIVAVLGCLAAGVTAAADADTKTGEAKFAPGKKDSVKVSVGKNLKLDAEYQLIDVGGLTAVSVRANVKNTTSTRLHYAYHVSFLDKDRNLVGCQSTVLSAEPGKQGPAGTFIQLPPDRISRIAYYSVALYESPKPIGSK
jgi:hypothetical protein